MGSQNYESNEPAEFNMGLITTYRINYWLCEANEFSFQNDVDNWFKALNILFREVYPFLNKEDQEIEDKKDKHIEDLYQKYLDYVKFYAINSKKSRGITFSPPRDIFDALDEWDKKLRVLLKKTGLLMKDKEKFAL